MEKNLTDWKKPYLMSQFDNDTPEDKTEEEPTESKSAKKLKLSKHTTMKGTAKVRHVKYIGTFNINMHTVSCTKL